MPKASAKSAKSTPKPAVNSLTVAGVNGIPKRTRNLLIVLAVVVASAIGLRSYEAYQQKQLKAKASTIVTWEAEAAYIQHPTDASTYIGKDKMVMRHDTGVITASGWKSALAGNKTHYMLYGPQTFMKTVNCGVFCWDNSYTASFIMRSVGNTSATARIYVHSNKARSGKGQDAVRSVTVAPGAFARYDVKYDLTSFFTAQASSCGAWGDYKLYCIQDAEFRVVADTGVVEVDKVQLWN